LLKTENFGSLWVQKTNESFNEIYSIFFINDLLGFAVGAGVNANIQKTVDGGETWTSQGFSGTLSSVFFVNENVGYIVGSSGIMRKTTDGGSNWSLLNTTTDNGLSDLFFINDSIGYVIGTNGTILKTPADTTSLSTSIINPSYNSSVNYFIIYPNPASNIIYSDMFSDAFYQIYDINGQLFSSGFSRNNSLNISNLTSGFYFIKVIKENKIFYTKFLKN